MLALVTAAVLCLSPSELACFETAAPDAAMSLPPADDGTIGDDSLSMSLIPLLDCEVPAAEREELMLFSRALAGPRWGDALCQLKDLIHEIPTLVRAERPDERQLSLTSAPRDSSSVGILAQLDLTPPFGEGWLACAPSLAPPQSELRRVERPPRSVS